MEIRVLGGVEVLDPEPIPLGGPTQRRTLAMLLVNLGQVVSIDQLIDGIWSNGYTPDNAEQTVPKYIHRLRVSLGENGSRIETVGAGYRLRLDAHELDARRFEDFVDQARSASAKGDAERVLEVLDRALALWRGRPYDDVADLDWARAEVARLNELHASAIERRFESLLADGRHTEVIGPLREVIEDEPWREPLRSQLALALYRAGRQAEALRAISEFRAELVDELGVDPSPDLDALEHRILDHDPSLLPPSHQQHQLRGYELDEVVGEGAFSLVWRGVQPSLSRTVAVKQIRAELANQPDFIRRFETEAQTVAALEHPYIVPLYDYWREPDSAYLVMRYVPGGSLESEVLTHRLDEPGLRRLTEQVGAALHTAHRSSVIHRDVKSANVLLDGEGNFYLTDFGIAFTGADDDELAASLSTGSPAYASPEQLRRQELDQRTDIYGFGITLFEAATGRLPFIDAATQAALITRQLEDPVPAPSSVDPSVPRWVDEIVARATAKNPADRYASMTDLMAAVPAIAADATVSRESVSATLVRDLVNPFKALRAFREADAGDFHGRDRLVTRLLEVLARPGSDGRLLAVVGPSGSGKSSAVRSGLLPRLRAGALPGSDDWFITTMMPGSRPFDELESALTRVAVRQPGPLVELMRDDPRGIARAVNQILPDEESELLLVIDQFEEMFTHTGDDERSRFLDGLLDAIREPRARLRVAVTIRADFWDRPLRHPGLAARIETAAVMVSPLAADELEAAIVEPVRRQGAEYEPGLVARIMADVGDQPGALPLLQYALTELFDANVSGLIRAESYDEIGGLTGALARRAEETLAAMSTEEQLVARRLFGRLVTLGEGTEDTRRRVRLAELGDTAEGVIEAFGAARLLVFDRDPVTRDPTVEIAHEALLQAWPRLRGWLDEDRDGLRLHRHLTDSTAAWIASDRDDGELYRGGRLETVAAWAIENQTDLNADERDFVDAGNAAYEAEQAAEREHLAQQVRSNRRLRVLSSIATVVAVIAAVAGAFALRERNRADDQADEAQRLAAEAQDARGEAEDARDEADASAAEAEARADEAETERDRADANADDTQRALELADQLRNDAERQALVESARRLGPVAEATADADLAVLLAVESARRAVRAGAELGEPVQALFATTSRHTVDARFTAWDVPHTSIPLVSVAPSGRAIAVVVSDGAGTDARHAEIIDMESGIRIEVGVDLPTSVAWQSDQDRLFVGSVGGVVWSIDPATGDATAWHDTGADWVKVWQVTDRWFVYQTGQGAIDGVATIAIADAESRRNVVERADATYAVVSPTGEHVVVAGVGGAAIHALPSGDEVGTVGSTDISLKRLDWTADGAAILYTNEATPLTRIEVPSLDESILAFSEPSNLFPTHLSVSPDGHQLAIADLGGAVRVFESSTLDLVSELVGHTGDVKGLDWAPDGRTLVSVDTSSTGNQILAWDLGALPRAPAAVWSGSSRYPLAHAVLSGSDRIVEARDPIDLSAQAERWSTGTAVAFEQPDGARGMVYSSPNESGLVVGTSRAGGIRGVVVSDVGSGDVLLDHVDELDTPLAMSPDGQTLIAGIGDASLFAGRPSLAPRIAAIDVASGTELWNLDGVRAQSSTSTGSAAVFVRGGEVAVLATGSFWNWLVYDRPAELLAVDARTGEVLASSPLQSAETHLAASPSGRRVATVDDQGRVSVLDIDLFLSGAADAEVASTQLASGRLAIGMAFSEDERTLYTPSGLLTSELLALAVDDDLELRWSVDVDVNGTDLPVSRPVIHDGHIWIAANDTSSPSSTVFGLVGIPTDLAAYAEWASTIPTRGFTEAECQRHLGGRCADVVSPPI